MKVRLLRSSVVKWIVYPLLGLAVVSVLAAGVTLAATRRFQASGRIAHHVAVGGVSVEGLTRDQALQRVQQQWLPTLPQELAITYGERSFKVSAEDLGRQPQVEQAVDRALRLGREENVLAQVATHLRLLNSRVALPVTITVDKTRAAAEIARLAAEVDREPVNARVTVTGSETVEVVPGKTGLKVDQKASVAAVATALEAGTADTAALTVRAKQPAITAAELAHLEVVLGSYSTSYSASKVDRTHNLQLAIDAINGTVVMPGEVFSADQEIGPRVAERGFRDAPIFADGEITPATGGGICQIATTIYNAALFAGLPVVERHHHSQPVTYAPAGRDATVYAGSLDLRFRNTTGYPLVVLGTIGGGRVTVNIVGKKEADRKVRLVSSGRATIAHTAKEVPDPTLPAGKKKVEEKGRDGITVTITRYLKKPDGTEEREVLHTDTYRPQQEVVRVGTKLPEIPLGPDGKPVPVKRGPDGKPLVDKAGKLILLPVKGKAPAGPAGKPAAGTKPAAGAKPAKPGAKPAKTGARQPGAKPAAAKAGKAATARHAAGKGSRSATNRASAARGSRAATAGRTAASARKHTHGT